MPAYSVPVQTKCSRCRTARVTEHVFNTYNESRGLYCKKCAAATIKVLNQINKELYGTVRK